jgi:hypothetical protein
MFDSFSILLNILNSQNRNYEGYQQLIRFIPRFGTRLVESEVDELNTFFKHVSFTDISIVKYGTYGCESS